MVVREMRSGSSLYTRAIPLLTDKHVILYTRLALGHIQQNCTPDINVQSKTAEVQMSKGIVCMTHSFRVNYVYIPKTPKELDMFINSVRQ